MLQFLPYRAIEWVEKFACGRAAARPHRTQVEQSARRKSHDVLDVPLGAADGHYVAGGKGWLSHAHALASRVPAFREGLLRCQQRDRGTKMRVRIVEKLHHERVLIERVLHDAALDTDPASMNQTDLAQARGVRRADVFVHHRSNVARQEGVKIEARFDRDFRSAPSLRF